MNIFVTGATGVLGKPVVRLLVEAGQRVSALSRSEANTALVGQLGAQPITANLFDAQSLTTALKTTQADAIIHLATKIPPTARMGKLSAWQANDRIRREGTRNLVDAALSVGAQTVIYPSFYFVYPDRGNGCIDARSTPVQAHVIQHATIEEFAQHGQPTDPGRPTSKIVTTGVFSVSRNPLYLGGVCILVGIALAANLPWVFVLLLPALVACHYILIAPEERYLAAKFGEEYRLYAATVHRWIGRTHSSR